MTKLITTVVTAIFVLLVFAAVAPRITAMLGALPPVIVTAAIAFAVARVVLFYTR